MDWQSKERIRSVTKLMRAGLINTAGKTNVSQQQINSLRQPKAKGPLWVAKFTLPLPKEDHVRELLFQVIDDLDEDKVPYARPQAEPIHVEWSGFRNGVSKDEPEPPISEKEKYTCLVRDSPGSGVVYFVHGGAFYMNNQASYRKITSRLSHMTGLPCMTVHQRLAPQNPFPAALLDVFHGYMSLLAPPPGSPHPSVPASSIVLAGDSSGACIALGLVQVLLTLKRSGLSSIEHHGRTVDLALPVGVTLISAVGELTNGVPSYKTIYLCDVFPVDLPPTSLPDFPACDLWPSKPPRGHIYCEVPLLHHPITSPTASRDWTGAPPLWFASGQEQIIDGVRVIAKTAYSQGVPVMYQEYEAMPHIFMLNLPDSPQSQKCWKDWAAVCTVLLKSKTIPSNAVFIEAKGIKPRQLDLDDLTKLTVEDARMLMRLGSKRFPLYTGQRGANSKL